MHNLSADSPKFVRGPVEEMTGAAGERVVMECEVDSNPPAEYSWLRGGDAWELVGRGPLLTFTLTPSTAGRYTCQAAAPGFSPVRRTGRVRLRGPPTILASSAAQFGSRGETVHVHCETDSVPAAKQFRWKFNGMELSRDSPLFTIIETRDGSRVKSTVIIKNAESHHFGEYLCGVSNEIGQTETVIKLKEIGKNLQLH